MIKNKLRSCAFVVLVIFTVVLSIHAQNQSPNQSEAIISGSVKTREGGPLINASVFVSRVGGSNSQTLRVDSNGDFKTEPLERGLYSVSASVPGFLNYIAQSGSPQQYYHPGDTVTLTMTGGGVITGKVTNSKHEPVIGIAVKAIIVRNREGKPVPYASFYRDRITDDRGVFRIFGLPPATYVVSAGGGLSRSFGLVTPTAYETDTPTYAPSSTRSGAAELVVNYGEEVTADIEFRDEPGHAISGSVTGTTKSDGLVNYGATISLFDLRNHMEVGSTSTSSQSNFAFAVYGVPDGDYEIYALHSSAGGDQFMSSPKQVTVQGSNITGIQLAVTPLASIEGRFVLETDLKAGCGKRRESATLETAIYARRDRSEVKGAQPKDALPGEVPFVYRTMWRRAFPDAKGSFAMRNIQTGTYRLDPREPPPGWYVRSIAFDRPMRRTNIPRDGLAVKSGEHVSGLLVTLTEGAGSLAGRISLSKDETLSSATRVYLTPFDRENADNPLRFFEAKPDASGSFTIDNIAPGKYLIITRSVEEDEAGIQKSIREDAAFRTTVLREAEAAKKEISFKPCEQVADFVLPYAPGEPKQ